MGVVEIIVIVGVVGGIVERIMKIFKDRAKDEKTKKKLETAEEIAGIFVDAIETVEPSKSKLKPVKKEVESLAKEKGLSTIVDTFVQSTVENK